MQRKRKSLSDKTRFEIFKRDSFTCQYCGKMAPTVVLECDHIDPVANGGSDEMMNLVTSCETCNSGKRARLLSDNAVLTKQQAELCRLAERRKQLLFLKQWRDELQKTDNEAFQFVKNEIESEMAVNFNLVPKHIKPLLKLENIKYVLIAIPIVARRFNGILIEGDVRQFSQTVSRYAMYKREEEEQPEYRHIGYIIAALKKRGGSTRWVPQIVDVLKQIVDAGFSIEGYVKWADGRTYYQFIEQATRDLKEIASASEVPDVMD
jgi:hypothetical protein